MPVGRPKAQRLIEGLRGRGAITAREFRVTQRMPQRNLVRRPVEPFAQQCRGFIGLVLRDGELRCGHARVRVVGRQRDGLRKFTSGKLVIAAIPRKHGDEAMRRCITGLRSHDASVFDSGGVHVALAVRPDAGVPPAGEFRSRRRIRIHIPRQRSQCRGQFVGRRKHPLHQCRRMTRRNRGQRPDISRRARRKERPDRRVQSREVDQHIGIAARESTRVRRIGL